MRPTSLQAIIPIKPLAFGKSRLSSILDDNTREALVLMMLDRVISTTVESLGPNACVVLGGDEFICEMALSHRIKLEDDNDNNLNDALWTAINLAKDRDYEATLILPADLPLLEPSDILALIEASSTFTCHVSSPASEEGGTNALLQPINSAIKPMMGINSFLKHRVAIESAHGNFVTVQRPGISFDLDNEMNYEWASTNIKDWSQRLNLWKSWLAKRKGLYG